MLADQLDGMSRCLEAHAQRQEWLFEQMCSQQQAMWEVLGANLDPQDFGAKLDPQDDCRACPGKVAPNVFAAGAVKEDSPTERGTADTTAGQESLGEPKKVLPYNMTAQLGSAKGWMSMPEHHEPLSKAAAAAHRSRRSCIQNLVHGHTFDLVCGVAIVANSVVLATSVNHMAVNDLAQQDSAHSLAQASFMAAFAVEVFLRMFADGLRFFVGQNVAWNWFDIIVLVSSVTDAALELAAGADEEERPQSGISTVRVLRILRLIRVIRIVRVLRFFSELRMMVASTLKSLKSLGWAIALLLLIIFIFGVPLTQVVTDSRVNRADSFSAAQLKAMSEFYGSLFLSIYTLFQVISGGISWRDCAKPLLDISWLYAIYICFFVSFTVFAVLNIVTGIFVGTAIQSAQQDRDVVIQEEIAASNSYAQEMMRLFEEADEDCSGFIDLTEFEKHLKDDRVRAYFRHLGLEVTEAWGLFRLLDLSDDGRVETHEFVMGCLRLKGPAKNIDVATLLYENKRMMQQFAVFMNKVEDTLAPIRDSSIASLQRRKLQGAKDAPRAYSLGSQYAAVSGGLATRTNSSE